MYSRATSRRLRSSEKTCSRPSLVSRTRPTFPSACRCRVIAWRVIPLPSLKRVIESGPSVDRRRTRLSRVASPSAANTGAAWRAAPPRLPDITRQLLGLASPSRLVHPERFSPSRAGEPVEAGLSDRHRGTTRRLFQPEFDQGGRLRRVIDLGIHRVGMPAVGEVALGFDPLDLHLQRDVLISRDGESAENGGACGERAVQLHTEPGAELVCFRDRSPDPGALGTYLETLLDPVGRLGLVGGGGHKSLSLLSIGCGGSLTCNIYVAYYKADPVNEQLLCCASLGRRPSLTGTFRNAQALARILGPTQVNRFR